MQAEEEARAGAPTLGALPIVAIHMREVTKKRDLMAFDGPDPNVPETPWLQFAELR